MPTPSAVGCVPAEYGLMQSAQAVEVSSPPENDGSYGTFNSTVIFLFAPSVPVVESSALCNQIGVTIYSNCRGN